jgi:hypothetical protein
MKKFLCLILTVCISQYAWSTEYYVSPNGDDSLAGTSPEKACKSIKAMTDKLQPGDILTLLPGEYLQQAEIKCSGTPEKPITIRGSKKDFCIIKSWKNLDVKNFKRVPEKRFVYSAPIKENVYNVIELGSEKMLDPAPDLSDMDHFRASYFFDKKSKTLYLHCSDGLSPEKHAIKITVNPGYIFNPTQANNLIFKDLTFCGSYAENPRLAGWGYAFRSIKCDNILIDNCSFFYNCGGAAISKGKNNTVQNCFCFNNVAAGYGELAQIMLSSKTENGKALNNTVLKGINHGVRFYSHAVNPTAIGNIVVNDGIGLYFKATRGKRLAERNVVVGCKKFNYSDMQGGRPIVDKWNTFSQLSFIYDNNSSNLVFAPKKDDPLFCDPDSLDFRLQEDSPFRKKGPDGADQGAYQFKANVYFLSTSGNDNNNGLSVKQAFRSLNTACSKLKSGDTLYILPGLYAGSIKLASDGTEDAPIVIRGRGREAAASIVSDDLPTLDLSGKKNVKIEKLILKSSQTGILLDKSENIILKKLYIQNCGTNGASISKSNKVRISHCTFAGNLDAAISVADSDNVTVDANILDSKNAPLLSLSSSKDFFSDYNNLYTEYSHLAEIDGKQIKTLKELKNILLSSKHSSSNPPLFAKTTERPHLSPESPCIGADGRGMNIGAYGIKKEVPQAAITELRINHLTPDSASISWSLPNTSSALWRVKDGWWAGRPVLSYLKYGTTPECKKKAISLGDIFNHVNLSKLEPDTKYYCQVVIPEKPSAWRHDEKLPPFQMPHDTMKNWRGKNSRIISFKTPKELSKPTPRTLYVSPEGNDKNNGTSQENAFVSLDKASNEVRPGDLVILLPGVYHGTFNPAVSGSPQYPITLKAMKAGTAVIDGSNNLRPCGVFLDSCNNIIIDGLIFRDFTAKLFGNRAGMDYGQIEMLRVNNITIKNCVFDCFSQYQPCVLMKQAENIIMKNNVFAASPAQLQGRKIGNLTIEGNTFFYTLITNFALGDFISGSKITIKYNLIVGQSKQKVLSKVGRGGMLRDIIDPEKRKQGNITLDFDYNIWYFSPDDPYRYCGFEDKFPDDAKPPFGIKRLQDKFGIEKNSTETNSLELSGIPVDYMNLEIKREILNPSKNEDFKLTLEIFEPKNELKINEIPVGARPGGFK